MSPIELNWAFRFGSGNLGYCYHRPSGQFGWRVIYGLPKAAVSFRHTTPHSGLKAIKRKAQGRE